MMHRLFRAGLVAAVVVGAGFALASSMEAQAKRVNGGESSVPTPRMPNGKPDLNGMWDGGLGDFRGADVNAERAAREAQGFFWDSRRCAPNQKGCHDNTNQNIDGEFTGRTNPNRPLYKPEYWDKVQELDYNTNNMDPMLDCQPNGIPRMGPPTKIVQTATELVFVYAKYPTPNEFRIIPVDGRAHDPIRAQDISYFGHGVGRWEGDTLVVDSVGFNDITWMAAQGGFFHSTKMRVTERLRRDGNTLHYQATVEDPEVLLEPWVVSPYELGLNPDPKATVYEGDICREFDQGVMISKIRH